MITDDCNLNCPFCIKREFKRDKYITKEVAKDAVRWILKRVENPTICLWGGEPFLNFEVIRYIVEEFPQIQFLSNTNGILINQEVYDWLKKVKGSYRLTLSVGGQVYNIPPIALKYVQDTHSGLNFTVNDPDTLFEDFCYLYGLCNRIIVEPPKGVEWDDKKIRAFEDNFIKILHNFKSPVVGRTCNNLMNNLYYGVHDKSKIIPSAAQFCGSGIRKLVVDTEGNIWQCDGFYINQENMLGTIYSGIDENKLGYLNEYNAKPKLLKEGCSGCDIYDICPRAKCLAQNFKDTGNILTPSKTWCDINKMWIRITKKWMLN
jgi:uncharacterized protein